MTERRRLATFTLTLTAIAAMLLLTSGLSELSLLPGQGLPAAIRESSTQADSDSRPIPGVELLFSAFRALFGLSVLFFPAAIIYVLVSPSARKRVLRDLGLALTIMLLYQYVGPHLAKIFQQNLPEMGSGRGLNRVDPSAFSTDFIANPPTWLVWGASLLIAMALIGLPLGLVAYLRWRSRQQASPLGHVKELAIEAQNAIDSLAAGADLKNVVTRCYARMSQVLGEKRGIHRRATMTPREFERRLRRAGLPNQPIHQLTELFERVRYGAKDTGPEEERRALESLRAIVQSCEATP